MAFHCVSSWLADLGACVNKQILRPLQSSRNLIFWGVCVNAPIEFSNVLRIFFDRFSEHSTDRSLLKIPNTISGILPFFHPPPPPNKLLGTGVPLVALLRRFPILFSNFLFVSRGRRTGLMAGSGVNFPIIFHVFRKLSGHPLLTFAVSIATR